MCIPYVCTCILWAFYTVHTALLIFCSDLRRLPYILLPAMDWGCEKKVDEVALLRWGEWPLSSHISAGPSTTVGWCYVLVSVTGLVQQEYSWIRCWFCNWSQGEDPKERGQRCVPMCVLWCLPLTRERTMYPFYIVCRQLILIIIITSVVHLLHYCLYPHW